MRLLDHALPVLLAIAATAGSCSEPRKSDVDPLAHLPIMSQLPLIEKDLLDRAQKNASKSCPRPVLRGEPLPDRAADDMVGVIESDDWDTGCRELLDERADDLFDALFHERDDEPAGLPPRRLDTSRSLDDSASRQPIVAQALELCSPKVVMLQRATRHEDACSPYLPGVRCSPSYMTLLRLSLAAVAGSRAHMRLGQQREAFETLADAIRFAQDFHRGGTSLIEAMIGAVVITRAASTIELQLNHERPVGPEVLAQIDRELEALVASEPHPSAFLRGDQLSMVVYLILPEAKGPDWTPPGGWAETCDRTMATGTGSEAALALVVAHRNLLRLDRACPPEATPRACAKGLERLARRLEADAAERGVASRILEMLTAADSEDEYLRQVVEVLDAIGTPMLGKYVARQGQSRFYLAALRLHAQYRMLAEQRGTCPGAGAFDAPPLADLRTETFSGGTMRVEPIGEGRFAVRPPPEVDAMFEENDRPAIVIDCPFR